MKIELSRKEINTLLGILEDSKELYNDLDHCGDRRERVSFNTLFNHISKQVPEIAEFNEKLGKYAGICLNLSHDKDRQVEYREMDAKWRCIHREFARWLSEKDV